MKKNLIIVALIVITFISMFYGYSQKVRAEQTERIAEQQTLIAERQTAMARQEIAIAMQNEKLAQIQTDSANVAMARAEECCNRCP